MDLYVVGCISGGAIIALVGLVYWIRQLIQKPGVLPPKRTWCPCSKNPSMLGWRVCLRDDKAHIHYAIFSSNGEWGKGEIDSKNLVVHLHGLAASLAFLASGADGGTASALVASGYTVLALDIWGHGFSDAPDISCTPSDFIEMLTSLFEHLNVREAFHLVGFSHGAFVAANFAERNPQMIKGLVLMSPFHCDLPLHSWVCFAAIITGFIQLTFEGNMSQFRTIYRIVLHMEGHRWPQLLKSLSTANFDVLVFAGSWECDPAMAITQHARRIHKALPKSQLQVMPRATHMTWATGSQQCQREIHRLLANFLKESARTDASPVTPITPAVMGTSGCIEMEMELLTGDEKMHM